MKNLIFVLFALSTSSLAQADAFSFVKENCTVTETSDLLFEIEENNFTSKVQVDLFFTGQNILLPKIRLKFLQHVPIETSIQWNSILSERKGTQAFVSEIRERVRGEEGKLFTMKKVSAPSEMAVFETTLLDLDRSQDLVALFLSQNEFIVSAHTNEGDVWQAKVSLNSSDTAFRQLGSQCYGALTAAFLKTSGERVNIKGETVAGEKLSSAAYHWSEGYGLTSYSFINSLLPASLTSAQVLAPVGAATVVDEAAANKKMADLLSLVNQKRTSQAELAKEVADPKYIELNDQLAVEYKSLQELYARFVVITGNSSAATDSLIALKIKEQKDLETAIANITASITEKSALQQTTNGELDILNQTLAPHLQQLTVFDKNLSDHATRIEQIKLLLDHLVALLTDDQARLGADAAAGAPLESAPWSIEEIDLHHKENVERDQKIQTIALLKSQLESLVGELNVLVEKAAVQDAAANDYLHTVGENRETGEQGISALRRSLLNEDNWLINSRLMPSFTMATPEFFLKLNQKVEADLAAEIAANGKTRVYATEFSFHKAMYATLEAQFNTQLENAKSATASDGSAVMIASILCKPDVLVSADNRTQPCLTIDEAVDDKLAEAFFMSLPPVTIDALLGNVQKPWTQDVSKTQILLTRFQEEMNSPTDVLQNLVNSWAQIRHIIWRWIEMQKKAEALNICGDNKPADLFADGIYSNVYYEKIFECEKAEVARHEQSRDGLLASITSVQATLDQKEAAFNAADEEFTNLSAQFINVSLKKITGIGQQEAAALNFNAGILQCALPLEKVEECLVGVNSGITNAGDYITHEQGLYLDLARGLVMNINAQNAALTEENRVLVEESSQIVAGKEAYIAENNVAVLLVSKTALETKLSDIIAQIATLNQQKDQSNLSLTQAAGAQVTLQNEARGLMVEIQNQTQKIQALLPSFTPFCNAIRPTGDRLQQIDVSLFQLLAPSNKAPEVKMYSSCQMPSLDNFTPHSEAIPGSVVNLPR